MERKDDKFEEEIRDLLDEKQEPLEEATEVMSWGDRLISKQELSPAYRKMAEMYAQGHAQKDIAEALGYTPSRVSIILSNSIVKEEVDRVRERIYEETVGKRLKAMADPALNVLEKALRDETHRINAGQKIQVAQWLIEKIDGKAVQKHGLEDNLLASVLDKLDAIKASGKEIPSFVDVNPIHETSGERVVLEAGPTSEKDELDDWVNQYN